MEQDEDVDMTANSSPSTLKRNASNSSADHNSEKPDRLDEEVLEEEEYNRRERAVMERIEQEASARLDEEVMEEEERNRRERAVLKMLDQEEDARLDQEVLEEEERNRREKNVLALIEQEELADLDQEVRQEEEMNRKEREARKQMEQKFMKEKEREEREQLSIEEKEMLLIDRVISVLPHLPHFRQHLISKRRRLDGGHVMGDDVPDVNLFKDTIQSLESVIEKLKSDLTQMEAAHARGPAELGKWCQESKEETTIEFKEWMKSPSRKARKAENQDSRPSYRQSEYRKYGRQMCMPEIGFDGQMKLRDSKVLIVGLGGLGCPAAAYLARAGVGTLGLVDGDTVEASNLHRQTLYLEEDVGQSKVLTANRRLRQMNSHIHYEGYNYRLTPEKAPKLFSDFDVILDCTDRQSSRYFISDAAVVARKPLIHASALGTVGQFMVLNNPPSLVDGNAHQGPCYRCIFPKPMRPENSRSCAEAGVLGPVVGVMGILMAMEAIKLLTQPNSTPWYMIYNAYGKEPFKILNLNRKNQNCVACSEKCTVTKELLESGRLDYDEFCGGRVNYDVLEDHQRMSVRDCKRLMDSKPQQHVLVDLRDKVQFDIGHVKESINLPISTIYQSPDAGLGALGQKLDFQPTLGRNPTVHFICRYGNDSRLALRQILDSQRIWEHGTLDYGRRRYLIGRDVIGGYDAWRKEIDPWLPDY